MSSVDQVYPNVDRMLQAVCQALATDRQIGVAGAQAISLDQQVAKSAAAVEAVLRENRLPVMSTDRTSLRGLVLGLDRALASIVPERSDPEVRLSGPLLLMRQRYNVQGWLNGQEASGPGLLPRRAPYTGRPRLPESLNDLCENVLLVSEDVRSRVRLQWVPTRFDLGVPVHLSVGMCPLAGPGDLIVERRSKDGLAYYSVEPSVPLEARVDAVVRATASLDLDLLVLPEAVCNPRMQERWQEALREADHDVPTWVMIGSGPYPIEAGLPANRAVLLHGPSGEVLMEQDKMAGFMMPEQTVKGWGLADNLGDGNLSEWMTPGRERVILESTAGRFAVVICEDLGRVTESPLADVLSVGPTHIVAPVFSRPIDKDGWEAQTGREAVHHCGAEVYVVNSLHVDPPPWVPADADRRLGLVVRPQADLAGFPRPLYVTGTPGNLTPDRVWLYPTQDNA